MTRNPGAMFEDAIERRLRPLAAAFASSDLVRIRVEDGDLELELRRAAAPVPREAAGSSPGAARPAESEAGELDVLTADLVGIVRFSRPAVKEGDRVTAEQQLASVEALGLRNHVTAKAAGVVAVVYVEEGAAVDYGAPLFAIRRDVR